MDLQGDLQGRTVIVTGGASGIGRATALLLAGEGAKVLVGDIDREGGRSAAAEGTARGFAVAYLPLDLTANTSVDASSRRRTSRPSGSTASSTLPVGTRSSPFSKTRRKCGTASSTST
jgi:hypothetical protein